MSDRKKKALGFFVSGAAFLVAGIVTWATPAAPAWSSTLLSVIGAVAAVVGIGVTLPEL